MESLNKLYPVERFVFTTIVVAVHTRHVDMLWDQRAHCVLRSVLCLFAPMSRSYMVPASGSNFETANCLRTGSYICEVHMVSRMGALCATMRLQ